MDFNGLKSVLDEMGVIYTFTEDRDGGLGVLGIQIIEEEEKVSLFYDLEKIDGYYDSMESFTTMVVNNINETKEGMKQNIERLNRRG